jgi:anti-sigma regulatory factor (Ser/Thr protein kinase)
VLLADELVANAVVHSTGPISLTVDVCAEAVRVEVADGDGGDPVVRGPGPGETHGRGLYLVDSLASSWGVEQIAEGKYVWFCLDFANSP